MTNVDLARIQFAFTSINHFLFVPITIGLAFLTALLQTAWHRSKQEEYLRLTRFFGTHRVRALRAQGDDRRGHRLAAGGAPLPGLDLLRVPAPRQPVRIRACVAADHTTGPPPGSNTRCRFPASPPWNLTGMGDG